MTPERFTALREHLKLTRIALAERLGCSRNTITAIESGQKPASKLVLNALSNVLNDHPPAS